MKVDLNGAVRKGNTSFLEYLQYWHTIDELDNLRSIEYDLIEGGYYEVVELRGIYVVHEIL